MNATGQAAPAAPPGFLPDPEQRQVLEHGRGPLLVLGRPGSGKSSVLRERFARLLEGGADPERVALVVGSTRARRESRAALVGRVHASLPDLNVMTVHGLARGVLQHRFADLGYERPPEILIASDQFSKVRELLQGEDPADWPAYGRMLGLWGFADQIRQFLLRAQEALLPPAEVQERASAAGLTGWRELARFYRRYLQVLDGMGAVDYAGLVEQAAAAAGAGEPLFDHLLVDDYQDTTFGAERLLVELRAQSLVVAGDPGSHVFSFRGSTDRPIRQFGDRMPSGTRVELRTDHRASQGRSVRAWFTPHTSEEHATVARELRRLHAQDGVPWAELAVVVRRQGSHLGGLLRALDDAGIPRSVPERGLSLLAEPATYPFVLALRWVARPEERQALIEPILTSDLARLSPAAARGLLRSALAAGSGPPAVMERTEGLSEEEGGALAELRAALAEAEAVAGTSVLETFSLLWRRLAHARRLVAQAEGSRQGRRNVDAVVALSQAVSAASERGPLPVRSFLDLLEAGQEGPGLPQPVHEEWQDTVRVFTAHGIVGQEFDSVIVTGAVEGSFPSLSRPEPMFDLSVLEQRTAQSQRNRLRLQDERRLFDVVATRARRGTLFTASDPHGQDTRLSVRSRFVAEAGVVWDGAPSGPPDEPLTVAEAGAAWRRILADPDRTPPARLAALDGVVALGVDCSSWWFQRDWSGTDRPLHETVRVSHSRLETLENCHLQFVLGQEIGLEGRAGYHAWVGHLVHRLIEDCENGAIERSQEALVAEAGRRWRRQEFPSFAVSEAFRRLVVEVMLPAWFREYGPAPALAKELRFQFEFDDAQVTGVIDRIGPVSRGGVQITDYKTGKVRNATRAEENLQLGIYYLAVNHAEELAGFRPVRGVELTFLRDRERFGDAIARAAKAFTGNGRQEFEESMAARLRDLIGVLRGLQQTEVYRPNPSANCRFCDFKPLCPLWPEGKDLFPVAPTPTEPGAEASR